MAANHNGVHLLTDGDHGMVELVQQVNATNSRPKSKLGKNSNV